MNVGQTLLMLFENSIVQGAAAAAKSGNQDDLLPQAKNAFIIGVFGTFLQFAETEIEHLLTPSPVVAAPKAATSAPAPAGPDGNAENSTTNINYIVGTVGNG